MDFSLGEIYLRFHVAAVNTIKDSRHYRWLFYNTKDVVSSVISILDYIIIEKDELVFGVGVCGYLDTSDRDPITFNMGKGQCSY